MQLDIGDTAPVLRPERWLKGAPVDEFKKGTVYALVFWTPGDPMFERDLPRLAEIERSIGASARWVGISTFGHWHQDQMASRDGYLARVNTFIQEHKEGLPESLCADDKQSSIGSLWLATDSLNSKDSNAIFTVADRRFPLQIPYAAIVNQDGKVAWMGRPEEMEAPLRLVIKRRSNMPAFKKKYDSQVAAQAAQHQLFRDLENAAAAGDKVLFEGLVDKLSGLRSNLIPFSINLAARRNAEFALSLVEAKVTSEREVQPVSWCNSLSIIADSAKSIATKRRAAELSESFVMKCSSENQAIAEAFTARSMASAGRKEEALGYLNKARALVAKTRPGSSAADYIESIGTNIR